jgi:internalin A
MKPWQLAVAAAILGSFVPTAAHADDDADTIRELTLLEFKVVTDPRLPGNPVVGIDCSTTKQFRASNALLPRMAKFKHLQTLNVRGSSLHDEGLMPLLDLPELHTLDLSDSKGIKDKNTATLARLKKARWLSLADTSITNAGLKDLKAMPALRHLDLTGTKVTDAGMKDLAEFPNLESLGLGVGMVTPAGLKDLRQSKTVKSLTLSGKRFNYSGTIDLAAAAVLAEFDRSSDAVTDAALVRLKDVEGFVRLDLTDAAVTDAGMKPLKGLKPLRECILARTEVTDATLALLKDAKGMERLEVTGTKVTDAGLKHVKDMKSLKVLRLSSTAITDAGLKELLGLKGLTFLDLSGTRITNAALPDVARFENLRTLSLALTRVSDTGLLALRRMPVLYSLTLTNTPVTKAGVEALTRTLPSIGVVWYDPTPPSETPKIDLVAPPKTPAVGGDPRPKKDFNSSVVRIEKASPGWSLAEVRAGTPLFADRGYVLEKVSPEFAGGTLLLRGSGECKTWLTPAKVTALKDGTAYVAVRWKYLGKSADDGTLAKLAADGWTEAKGQLVTSFPEGEGWQWKVLRKKIKKGEVTLTPGTKSEAMPLLFLFKEGP